MNLNWCKMRVEKVEENKVEVGDRVGLVKTVSIETA